MMRGMSMVMCAGFCWGTSGTLQAFAPAGSGARMQGLCAAVQADPGQAWPVARMAAFVRDWLVAKGYDEKMGARPMARVIQEHIKKPLAEILLFGELEKRSGVVRVSVDGDGLKLYVEPLH